MRKIRVSMSVYKNRVRAFTSISFLCYTHYHLHGLSLSFIGVEILRPKIVCMIELVVLIIAFCVISACI